MEKKTEEIKRMPVYFPLELYAKVQEGAKMYRRSLNKEVIWRLEQSYQDATGLITERHKEVEDQ
jgi:hypothetical protein